MTDIYSFDEFVRRRQQGTPWQPELPTFMSFDEFVARREGIQLKREQDLSRYASERDEYRGILPVFEQFARGVGSELTFGFGPKLWGKEEPRGTPEKLARGIGGFLGFLGPLVVSGGAVSAAGKGLGLTTKAARAYQGGKIAKELVVAGKVGRTAATLGLASGISDIPGAIESPASALQRAKEGAALGAIFGAVGLVDIGQYKTLSWLLRQFGGRAALNAAGLYDPTKISKESLAESVFTEALHTFFLWHGVSPEKILKGDIKNAEVKRIFDNLEDNIITLNEHTARNSKLRVPFGWFREKDRAEVNVEHILARDEFNPEQVKMFKDALRRVDDDPSKARKNPLRVEWDDVEKKWRPAELDNEFFIAIKDRFKVERPAEKKATTNPYIKVQIAKPKPGTPPFFPSVIRLAMQFYAAGKVDKNLLQILTQTRYWAYNIDKKILMPKEGKRYPTQVKIGKRDILLEVDEYNPVTKRYGLRPIGKGSKVPKFTWDAKKVFSRHKDDFARYQEELAVEHYEYVYPQLLKGDRSGIPEIDLATYDSAQLNLYNIYKKNVVLEERIAKSASTVVTPKGVKRKWTGIEKAVDEAERQLRLLRSLPELPLPATYVAHLENRAKNLRSGITLDAIQNAMYSQGETLKVKHLSGLQDYFLAMEKAPLEDRLFHLFRIPMQDSGADRVTLSGNYKQRQAIIDGLNRKRRKRFLAEAEYNAKHHPEKGSVIHQLLTTGRARTWMDFNKWTDFMENRTGIPLYKFGRVFAHDAAYKQNIVLPRLTKRLNHFADMPPQEQAGIYVYYRRLYNLESIRDLPLNKRQMAYIGEINKIMKELAPEIIKERHSVWMDTVYAHEMRRTGEPYTPPTKAFPSQDKPDVHSFLWEGAKKYEQSLTGHPEVYEQWIHEAIQKNIGTIGEGVYLPEFVIKGDKMSLDGAYEAANLGFMGRGHFKSRTQVKGEYNTAELFEELAREFLDRNIHTRVYAYINHVLNIRYVEPHIKVLEHLVNVFPQEFKDAKPAGFGRRGKEAKTLSLLDYLRLYAHRMKGYPVKIGPIGDLARTVQSAFFRSLTVRPFLITRNLPQRFVAHPHKINAMDPRFIGQKRFLFKAMSERAKGRFRTTVSQQQAFKQDFLQLMQTEKWKDWPFVGWIFRAAERVGSLYSLSDEFNRRFVFSKAYHRGMHYMKQYESGKISLETLERHLGILKMEANPQRMWREYLEQKDGEGAIIHLAEWTDANTNWFYKRTEKSLAEMTGEGEAWTNLITWSKGIVQWTGLSIKNVKDGFDLMKGSKINSPQWKVGREMMFNGSGKMVGLLLMGALTNELLNTLAFRHGSKYTSYGTDMFMWEIGGVSLEIMKQFSSSLAQLITSIDGSPAERKAAAESFSKMLDNQMIRQLIPFSKNLLSTVEAFTGRSHISPIYEKWTKLIEGAPKQKTYVQRTLLEGVSHAIFATDPNKSADFRKFIFNKKMETGFKKTQPGPLKHIYEAMHWKYSQLLDLLMRYEPYELMRDSIEKDWLQKFEDWEKNKEYEDWLYDQQADIYRQQRRWE